MYVECNLIYEMTRCKSMIIRNAETRNLQYARYKQVVLFKRTCRCTRWSQKSQCYTFDEGDLARFVELVDTDQLEIEVTFRFIREKYSTSAVTQRDSGQSNFCRKKLPRTLEMEGLNVFPEVTRFPSTILHSLLPIRRKTKI